MTYERNILLYRIHALFNEPIFWGAVLILTLQKLAHMSLSDIYLMESAVLCICVLMDIPSGALADVIGRKKTILLGRGFLLASTCVFTFMSNPLEAWIGNILWALGFSLQSGADTALLYESLKEVGREKEYKKIEGQAIGARMLLIGCCILIAGWLAQIDLRLPLYLSLPFVAIPFFTAFFFKEPLNTEKFSATKQLAVFSQGLTFMRGSISVRWMILFAALLATTSKVWFFTYNPYFEYVGLPLVEYGIIFSALNIVAWSSSHYAHKLESIFGEQTCIVGMVALLGLPILLMALFPSQPLAYLVLVQNVVRGFMRPFVGDFMNRHIESSMRATVLSMQSSMANLVSVVALFVFGVCIKSISLLNALLILGALVLCVGLWSINVYIKKIR